MTISVGESEGGARLDAYLAGRLKEFSRSRLAALIDEGAITVDTKKVRPSHRLSGGEAIVLTLPELRPAGAQAQAIPLEILFEDADLLVVNKPRGMASHPAPGTPDQTLVNALLAHCKDLSGIGGQERPGIVHRLDKETSGLLMVAKHDSAHVALQRQIQSREARRRYQALVWGSPRFSEAHIDAPVGRHPGERVRMCVDTDGGREARTHVLVLERLGPATLLECRLETGRTHQIRVHCQFAGYPVVGDPLYGGLRKSGDKALDARVASLGGQALHAFSLAFSHPRTGEPLAFVAPLPPVFQELLDRLREIPI